MKKTILSMITILFTISIFAQTNNKIVSPFEPSVVTAFAQDLYENGFIDEAESEFKRSLFLQNASAQEQYTEQQEQIIFTLTSIYNAQDNKSGIQWLEDNFTKGLSLDVKEKVDFVNARLIFKERTADGFNEFIDSIQTDLSEYEPSFQLLTVISQDLFLYNIDDAAIKANEAFHEYKEFEQFSKACAKYNTKSAALATTLSIFIPGAGKWYTSSFNTFLTSFLTIGSFVGATVYTGIDSQWKDWRPYVFGTCALGLYIADIYSSYKAAKRYNEAQYRNLCSTLDLVYEDLF